jgi:hypothetical protein
MGNDEALFFAGIVILGVIVVSILLIRSSGDE